MISFTSVVVPEIRWVIRYIHAMERRIHLMFVLYMIFYNLGGINFCCFWSFITLFQTQQKMFSAKNVKLLASKIYSFLTSLRAITGNVGLGQTITRQQKNQNVD